MKLGVAIEGVVVGPGGPDGLEHHLDGVMDELVKLDADDPSVSATLATGAVEVTVVVEAATWEEGVRLGLGTIRSAIHAAGGATPDWSGDLKPHEWGITLEETSVRKAGLVDA